MAFREYFQHPNHDSLRSLIYTPLEDAIALLKQRQNDPAIDVSGINVPDILNNNHIAVLPRQIATPNYEMQRVIKLTEKYKLNLIVFTFEDDKFSSVNYYKHSLGKMGFFQGKNYRDEKKLHYQTIIKFNECNGKPLKNCKTIRGQSLIDFHHTLLFSEFPQLKPDNLFEFSDWLKENRLDSGNFYNEFLTLFLKHAILFETFVLSNNELDFTVKKLLPAFHNIYSTFGIKPLIVHSEAPELEGDNYWQHYPEHLLEYAPVERRKKPR